MITPWTPIPVLQRMIYQSYFQSGFTCAASAFLIWLAAVVFAANDYQFRPLIVLNFVVLAVALYTSSNLFMSAAALRRSLRSLIENKRQHRG